MKTLKLFAIKYPIAAGTICSFLVYAIVVPFVLFAAPLGFETLTVITWMAFLSLPNFVLSFVNSRGWVFLPIFSLVALFAIDAFCKPRLVKFISAFLIFYIIILPVLVYYVSRQSTAIMRDSFFQNK